MCQSSFIPTRRRMVCGAAALSAVSSFTCHSIAAERTPEAPAIRPFAVNIPDGALIDLRRRIADTRWPEKETVADQSQGVPLAKLQELARYWGTDYASPSPWPSASSPASSIKPRSWTERAYPKLIYYHRAEKGGHFAAWEQPGFSLRKSERRSPRYADESMTHLEGSGV
jgi:hypothetical protein